MDSAKTKIRELERLLHTSGVDRKAVADTIEQLRFRQAELERTEALRGYDGLFVNLPVPLEDTDSDDSVEAMGAIIPWSSTATNNEIGLVAERAAARWAEQHFGLLSDSGEHHVNAHGVDHVFINERNGGLIIGETKGTRGINKTEQARYKAGRPPEPKQLLGRNGQMSDDWIAKDSWIKTEALPAEAVTDKLFFRVDVTLQSIDVFASDKFGMLTERLGTFHCNTRDLVESMQADGTLPPP